MPEIKANTMTRLQMIKFIHENPNVRITHFLFSENEFIYSVESGEVYDENGYLFEDWNWDCNRDGIRMRQGGYWEDGWSLWKEKPKKVLCKECQHCTIEQVQIPGDLENRQFKQYYCYHPRSEVGTEPLIVEADGFCSYGEPKKVNLEDVVDLDALTAANNAAMRKVIDFMAGEGSNEDGR